MPINRHTGKPPPKDAVEKMAEEDVARLQKLLQRTKAEVARSKKLADRIDRRHKTDPDKD